MWRCAAVGLLLLAGAVGAEEEERNFGLGLAVGTDLPLSAGIEAQLDAPGRLYLTVGAGQVPQAVRRIFSDTGAGLGAWREESGRAVFDNGRRTQVLTATLGWRPFRAHGFVLEADAARVRLPVSGPPALLLNVFPNGQRIAAEQNSEVEHLDATVAFDLVGGQVGWQWHLGPLFARVGIGGLMAVRAWSDVSLDSAGEADLAQRAYLASVRQQVETEVVRRVKLPTLSLRLGTQLF
jgi:hypothetical protein